MTGDVGDAGSTALPSFYLDAGAKKWVPMMPKRDGTVVGATRTGGKSVPVELVGEDLWIEDRSFKTGLSKPQSLAGPSGPLPFTSLL